MTADPAAHAAAASFGADGTAPPDARPVALVFRHLLQGRLETLFTPGERVLDLGGGGGADASFLFSRGVRVARLERLEGLAAAGSGFDGAFSTWGALDGADLPAVGAALAEVLRPGAAVLVCLPGPWPLPGLLRLALTGVGERRRPHRVVSAARAPAPPTLREARRAMGHLFTWTDTYALGVLLPEAAREDWVKEHPQAFAMLAMGERAVRRWPGLRQLGDQLVLEGHRVAPR